MTLTGWNERMSVGHDMIDGDHIELVELLDQLDDAVTNHLGLETYGKVLNQLMNKIRAHFASEEALMAEHHYAQTDQHVKDHGKLMRELFEFKARFDANATTLSIAQLKSFEESLIRHIMETDKALAEVIPAR